MRRANEIKILDTSKAKHFIPTKRFASPCLSSFIISFNLNQLSSLVFMSSSRMESHQKDRRRRKRLQLFFYFYFLSSSNNKFLVQFPAFLLSIHLTVLVLFRSARHQF